MTKVFDCVPTMSQIPGEKRCFILNYLISYGTFTGFNQDIFLKNQKPSRNILIFLKSGGKLVNA